MSCYGNSTGGFDAAIPEPTMILECGYCAAEILFLGDGDEVIVDGQFILPEYYIATCPVCNAVFGAGDTLEVIPEPDSACGGFGCVDGCGDCMQVAAC